MSKKKDVHTNLVVVIVFITVCIMVCIFYKVVQEYNKKKNSEELGINTVKLLYDFRDYDELAANQVALMECTTEEVYNQLTFDNEERTLYTYLKFAGESSSVEVIKSTDSYVLYTLNTAALLSGRKFIFLFEVDSDRKICYAREEECIDFVDYIRTDY